LDIRTFGEAKQDLIWIPKIPEIGKLDLDLDFRTFEEAKQDLIWIPKIPETGKQDLILLSMLWKSQTKSCYPKFCRRQINL